MARHSFLLFLMTTFVAASSALGQHEARGILFDAEDIPRFRQFYASDPLFSDVKALLAEIDRAAEREFLRTKVRYNDQLYDIGRVGDMAINMAFLYLYTEDEDAASLAVECVESLMKFPKWDYFLEGGTDVIGLQRAPNSALAVSLVIECLGKKVSAADRKRWLEVMAVRGVEPCFRSIYGMRYPDRVKGWGFDTTSTYLKHRPGDRGLSLARWPIILNTINLKAVPASTLALSALTYRKYMGESDNTRRWIEQALFSLGTFRDIYLPDGSYGEGVSYAQYTTLNIVEAIEACRRAGVADIGDLLNWQGYQTYLLEMTQPTRTEPAAIVNFSDASQGATAAVPFWTARHTRDGLAQWFGKNMSVHRDVWSILWYDPSVPEEPPSGRLSLWKSDLDWVVARTGYGVDDLVVAMRSGSPMNHEHADRNSLLLKCYGEKLITDPMRPPYNFVDPAWRMRLTEGHSALLIDGKGHQYVDGHEGTNASRAQAEVIRSGVREHYAFWTSDATQAYALVMPDVASVTRTVLLLQTVPAAVVIDKVIKKSEPSRIQARFFAYNNDGKGSIAVEESGFTVVRPGALLGARSIANGKELYRTALLPIPEEQAKMHPYAEVATESPKQETILITVLLPFMGSSGTGTVQVKSEGNTYSAHIGNASRAVNVRVFDTGAVPEFEVR